MGKRFSILGDTVADVHGDAVTPGAAGAFALALRDLGGDVTLRSAVGTDAPGDDILADLRRARVHPGQLDRQDGPTATRRWGDDGRIIDHTTGAGLHRHSRMDIYDLFSHDTAIVASYDQPLREFISDLPAHTVNTVRLITSLEHLDASAPTTNELEIAMRFDVIVGTEVQLMTLTGAASATDALGDLFDRMHTTALRAAIAVTDHGIEIISRDDRVLRPVQGAIPSFLLPQVLAGAAWGLAHHMEWDTAATIMADPAAAL